MIISRNPAKHLIVLMIYLIITVLATWPVALHMSTHIYANNGDALNSLWFLQWQKDYAAANGFSLGAPKTCDLIAYPYGFSYGNVPPEYSYLLPVRVMAIVFNPALAYNLMAMLSFAIAAFMMYLLAFYLTRNTLASFFAGLVFGFSPWHFVQAREHLGLTNTQWIPLYFLSLFYHSRRQTWSSAWLMVSAFLLLVFGNLYYAVFAVIATLVFMAIRYAGRAWFLPNIARVNLFMTATMTVAICCITILGFRSAYMEQKTGLDRHRVPLWHVEELSASLRSYMTPPVSNPLLSANVGPIKPGSVVNGYLEMTMYLGVVPLALAFLGAMHSRRHFKKHRKADPKDSEQVFLSLALIMIFVVSILFSLKPFLMLGGYKMPMPGYIVYKVFPFLRLMSRWMIFANMAMAALASIGIASLNIKLSRTRAVVFVGMAVCLLAIEYLSVPEKPLYDYRLESQPKVYQWLISQPGQRPIAEYPVPVRAGTDFQKRGIGQIWHKRPTIDPELYLWLEDRVCLDDLDNTTVISSLAGLGAEYLIVHTDEYRRDGKPLPDLDGDQVTRVAEFSGTTVYRITTRPQKAVMIVKEGSFDPQIWGGWLDWPAWRWAEANLIFAAVLLDQRSMRGDIVFDIKPLGRRSTLTLSTNGKTCRSSVQTSATSARFKDVILHPGTNIVSVKSDSEPISINAVLANGDIRSACYGFSNLRFENNRTTIE